MECAVRIKTLRGSIDQARFHREAEADVKAK
jgi:hypothetical protein